MVIENKDVYINDELKENALKYFRDYESLENEIQKNIDILIKEFNKPSSSVHAVNNDSYKELKSKFGDSSIYRGILCNKNEINKYISEIKKNIVDNSTRVSSPNMIGHMTSALPFFHKPLSKLITAINQNVVKVETSATTTFLEKETLSKLHRAFFKRTEEFYNIYLKESNGSFGCITSGGTVANITAMWVARNKAFPKTKNFEGIEKEGVISALKYYNYNNMAIVGSELMHYSFKKAADLLGLGLTNIYSIPVDSNFRIRIDLLENKLKELEKNKIKVIAIIGIACTTETGTIDDLDRLADLAEEYNTLFHVDGAWGGSFILSKKYNHLLKGIERADTITVDGHKLLYTPIGCGVILFKSPTLPNETIKKVASYIIREHSLDHGKITLEGSRPANVLYLHASLSLLGRDGLSSLLEIAVENTKYMENLIKSYPQFEIISTPVTNIFLYRYIPSWLQQKKIKFERQFSENKSIIKINEKKNCKLITLPCEYRFSLKENIIISDFTSKLQIMQKTEGCGFVSKTRIKTTKYSECLDGISVFRVVIANPLVTTVNINKVIKEQIEFGLELEKEYKINNKIN